MLVTLDDVKDYLKIEHDADDAQLDRMVASALGQLETLVDRPIAAEIQTHVVEDPRGPCASGLAVSSPRRPAVLRIPMTPVAASPFPIVFDADGVQVAAADLRLNSATGVLTPAPGVVLDRWPYTITSTVGLATRADYTRVVAPALAQALIDTVADWYQRRNPAATQESSGGGVATTYGRADEGLPLRVTQQVERFCRVTA